MSTLRRPYGCRIRPASPVSAASAAVAVTAIAAAAAGTGASPEGCKSGRHYGPSTP